MAGMPALRRIQEVKQMPSMTEVDNATIEQIRADRAAGVSINKLAKKHGLTWSRVNAIFSNGNKAAGGANRDEARNLVAARAR